MKSTSNIAIITARGGSKRIPRKNIKSFLGRPIIDYSIKAALDSQIFSEVMVSTDDEEIAQIAHSSGAVIPFMRSKKNSDDFATTAQVIIEVLQEYSKIAKNFESYCCIYPTAPFVTANKLKAAHNALVESKCISLIPVVRFGYPIQRALQVKDGLLSMIDMRYINSRSQDLSPAYHDCGQFYMGQSEHLLQTGQIFCEKTLPFVQSEIEVQDIDHEEDWLIAELKYKLLVDSGKI